MSFSTPTPMMRVFNPVDTPQSPASPRNVRVRLLCSLAVIATLASVSALLCISLQSNLARHGMEDPPTPRRLLARRFLFTSTTSKLLEQSKPLLVAEEELDDGDMGLLMEDQSFQEEDARALLQDAEAARQQVVRQLITEYSSAKAVSEQDMQRLAEEWHRADEDLNADPKELWEVEAVFGAEDETYDDLLPVAAAEAALQWREAKVPWTPPRSFTLKESLSSEAGRAALWDTGRGDADQAHLGAIPAGVLGPDAQQPTAGASFAEALAGCTTLKCLRAAHARPRSPGQFNFPHALLAGWQKAGTTNVYAHLKRHPQVVSSEVKEPEFFTYHCGGDPSACPPEQQAYYITRTLRRDIVVAANASAMAFEASTHYAMNGHSLAAGIRQEMPWVRVVLALREPISRAASMLVHMLQYEGQGCLAAADATLYRCLTTASQLVGHPGPWNCLDSPHGNYSHSLGAWLAAFPQEQVHVVQYEALAEVDSAQKALQRMKDFLGVDAALPSLRPELEVTDGSGADGGVTPRAWGMRRHQYLELIGSVLPDVDRVASMAEENGWGPREEWLAAWRSVWDANLATCSSTGWCTIRVA